MFVDYVTGNAATSTEHTFQVRFGGDGVVADDAQNFAYNLLNSIGAATFVAGWRVIRVRAQAANADFSLPVPVIPLLAGFAGTSAGAYPQNREAEEWTFQGRSQVTGRKVDISLYGIATSFPTNFRLPAGGSSPAWVAAAVNQLNNVAFADVGLAIDGTKPLWYQYVNANYNSYWEREKRVG